MRLFYSVGMLSLTMKAGKSEQVMDPSIDQEDNAYDRVET
ncbi:hypothetical protein PF010_g24287 [Phytophthora fragariae]|uniref:Uncharacterized protein n=1 Tax=Phytophthora fragariae TaxID=53985 RepID=A0A6G0K311_9STRA|nr:hypothetical protein PF010_g24287 [Phytophthora fragariae]